jgi:hypothetical protein
MESDRKIKISDFDSLKAFGITLFDHINFHLVFILHKSYLYGHKPKYDIRKKYSQIVWVARGSQGH